MTRAEEELHDPTINRYMYIHQTDRQTDRQTADRQFLSWTFYISVSYCYRSASFQRAMETDMVSDRDLRVAPTPKRKQL